MLFRHTLIAALALGVSSAAHAVECYQPPIFLLPVVVSVAGAEPAPMPFDWKADVEVTLKGTSCENSFTTVAGQEVTFGWTLSRAGVQTLTFTLVGSHTKVIKNGDTVTLPEGKWKLRIERAAPKVGRLEHLKFTLRTRFQGEVMP